MVIVLDLVRLIEWVLILKLVMVLKLKLMLAMFQGLALPSFLPLEQVPLFPFLHPSSLLLLV